VHVDDKNLDTSSFGNWSGLPAVAGLYCIVFILLFHIISARPSKQPRMVRSFLKVHTRLRLAYPLRCRGY